MTEPIQAERDFARPPAPASESVGPDSEASARSAVVAVPLRRVQADRIRRFPASRGRHVATKFEENIAAHDDDIEALIKAVDDKTQQAYRQVLTRPLFTGLESLVSSNGLVGYWVEGMQSALTSKVSPSTLSARFGYAVEALATVLLGNAAGDWRLTYQVAAGGTRPDVVATKGLTTVWLDLTAAKSIGHIYKLKGWFNPKICPHPHSEIIYPSLDQGTFALLLANGGKETKGEQRDTVLDPAALSAQLDAARLKHEADLASWEQRFGRALPEPEKVPSTAANSKDETRRLALFEWFNGIFGTRFPTAPSTSVLTKRRQRDNTEAPTRKKARPDPEPSSSSGPLAEGDRMEIADPAGTDNATAESEPVVKDFAAADLEASTEVASVLMALGRGSQLRKYGLVGGTPSVSRGVAFLERHDNSESLPKEYRRDG